MWIAWSVFEWKTGAPSWSLYRNSGVIDRDSRQGHHIIVTVSDVVNIIIPASSTGTAKYVDIDIDRVSLHKGTIHVMYQG